MLALAAKGLFWGDLGDQLGVDEKTKSKKRDGGATRRGLPGGTSVADSPFSTGGASQLILQYMDSVQTHPVATELLLHKSDILIQYLLFRIILSEHP